MRILFRARGLKPKYKRSIDFYIDEKAYKSYSIYFKCRELRFFGANSRVIKV
jgi:hypothetical protein